MLRTDQDFRNLAKAYLDRAHAQGVVHAEIMFDAQMHTERSVPLGAVVEDLSAACDDALREHGMTSH